MIRVTPRPEVVLKRAAADARDRADAPPRARGVLHREFGEDRGAVRAGAASARHASMKKVHPRVHAMDAAVAGLLRTPAAAGLRIGLP